MATSPFGNYADLSAYQREVAAKRAATPAVLDSILQGIQQGVALEQLPQTIQNKQLADQISQALQVAKLQQLQNGQVENVGGRLVRYNPITGKAEVILEPTAPAPNFQFAGFSNGQPVSFDPRNNSLTTPTGVSLSGPLTPKTVAPETFSTVVADQGIQRVGSRSTQGVPMLTSAGAPATAPVKQGAVSRFSDANGFLFNQSSTGGAATPVVDADGNPINIGVPNQIIGSDQGLMRVPTRGGEATPVVQGGIPLTKTPASKASATSGASAAYQEESATRNLESISDLKGRVSSSTVGPAGLLSKIPGTGAADFAADLDTLKANIAFGALAAMRASSKTGGALGSVSDREGKLLESSLGALSTNQSPANFKKNLDKIEASINRWKETATKELPKTSGKIEIIAPDGVRGTWDASKPIPQGFRAAQ